MRQLPFKDFLFFMVAGRHLEHGVLVPQGVVEEAVQGRPSRLQRSEDACKGHGLRA